jgi:hypothetical protein
MESEALRPWRRAGKATLLACLVSCFTGGTALGQARPKPQPAAKQAPAGEPARDPTLERIAALEAELERQRAELAAQRAALEEQRAALEEQRAAAGAKPEEAQLAELLASAQSETPAQPSEPLLRLYGFADVGLQRMWTDREIAGLIPGTTKTTFVLGNLNLYLDANPSKDFRFLAEVRFGLFPNGSVARPNGALPVGEPIDTSVTDPSATNSGFNNISWAGVSVQRAHIDYTPSDHFNLRAGLFLNPYGIWNVDHGTPTRIMLAEPLFLAVQLIPKQLVGVEGYGTVQVLPWTIGYHLHVSNGRTTSQLDFSDSKAFGARLFISTRNPFPFKLGISGYTGNAESQQSTSGQQVSKFAYREYALSGDLSLDLGGLRIRSELVAGWTYYEPGKRQTVLGLPLADSLRLGAYLMLAYQLPWYGIEPLLMCEILRIPLPRALPVGEGIVMPSVGINVYFTTTTMLRTQFAVAHGFDLSDHPIETHGFMYQAVARLITAF